MRLLEPRRRAAFVPRGRCLRLNLPRSSSIARCRFPTLYHACLRKHPHPLLANTVSGQRRSLGIHDLLWMHPLPPRIPPTVPLRKPHPFPLRIHLTRKYPLENEPLRIGIDSPLHSPARSPHCARCARCARDRRSGRLAARRSAPLSAARVRNYKASRLGGGRSV